jgi:acetyl-CoA acetyltransferase family protein
MDKGEKVKEVVVLDGARTPFGEFCGSVKDIIAIDLGAIAARGAMERCGVKPEQINHVIFGNAMQTSGDAIYGARHVALKSGCPVDIPAITVNRICGSGLQAIVYGAQLIQLGEAEICLVGGMENMSQCPHVIRGARWGLPLGQGQMEDSLWVALLDSYNNMSMAITAENLAVKYNISREEQDEYALRSQIAAITARDNGLLKEEIVPVVLRDRRGNETEFWTDEHIRETSLEKLAKLRPVFKKDGGVTAGNASGINDGAAALVIASADKAKELGLTAKASLVSHAVCAVDPDIMGIGPAPSIRSAADRAGVRVHDFDLVEINEAFAAQYLACEKELELDRNKVNVNGGAIAIGHPLGASGARLALTAIYEMHRRAAKTSVASLCIGGGQGIAAAFEKI